MGRLRGARVLGLVLDSQGIVCVCGGVSLVGGRLMGTLGALENYDSGVLGMSQESRLDSGVVLEHGSFWRPGGSSEVWIPPDDWGLLWKIRGLWIITKFGSRCGEILLESWGISLIDGLREGPGALEFTKRLGISIALELTMEVHIFWNLPLRGLGVFRLMKVIFKMKRTLFLGSSPFNPPCNRGEGYFWKPSRGFSKR